MKYFLKLIKNKKETKMNKKFEIPRDKLLEIKHSNYELYQLICSFATNEEEKDYCEILDKAKLAKECELGYFNIDDLFTREQICNAYYRDIFQKIVPEKPINALERESYPKFSINYINGNSKKGFPGEINGKN